MNPKNHYLRILPFLGVILLVMACALPTLTQKKSDESSVSKSESSGTNQTNGLDLTDPAAGLENLTSYHVLFQQDITGTLDGKPFERHTKMELSRLNSSGQFDYANNISGSDTQNYQVRLVTSDDAYYRWMQSNPDCQGSISPPAQGEVIEPANLLLPVTNAKLIGSETINSTPSIHYQFDQKDLPIAKDANQTTGDVWIAEQGGYVVRYILNSTKPDKLTGKDLEVDQQWTYDLDQVNALPAIDLPSECLPVPAGLPTPDDAQDVQQISGRMSFTTAMSGRQVVDFYYQELPAMGWDPHNVSPSGDITLPYLTYFDQGSQRLTLYINEGEQKGVDVDLLITIPEIAAVNPHEDAAETPAPAVPVDPATSGLPDDIPLYPGATDLIKTGELVMFNIMDTPADAADYYRQQMTANGWELDADFNNTDVIMQTWKKSKLTSTVTIITQDGETSVIIKLMK